MKRPNILLITIEKLRGDFPGYAGCKDAETPFIDKLASSIFLRVSGLTFLLFLNAADTAIVLTETLSAIIFIVTFDIFTGLKCFL